jgi:uncharacterized protein (DUF433 family)
MTAPNQSEGTDWQDRIVCDPAVLNGAPTIRDTGIAVALVNQLLGRGNTVDAIIGNYLHITEEDVDACRRYHEAEMERGLADMIGHIEKATPGKVADWRERIVCDPAILVGKPTIKGTRISVELVTSELKKGTTVSEILDSYPHIRAEDVDACVKYKATGASLSRMSWDEYDARMANVEPQKS